MISKGCRAVTEFAADLGIKTTVENHGFFCQDSDRVEKLANAVGHAYLRGSIIGHGDVPITQCLKVMKAAGYDGVLSIEFEGIEDPLQAIPMGRDNLVRFLREIG